MSASLNPHLLIAVDEFNEASGLMVVHDCLFGFYMTCIATLRCVCIGVSYFCFTGICVAVWLLYENTLLNLFFNAGRNVLCVLSVSYCGAIILQI